MSSGFLLVETENGREDQVYELLARIPGVTDRHILFPSAIAARLELPREALDPALVQLNKLEGVLSTRLYHSKTNT